MTEPRFLGGRYELGEVLGHGGMAEVRIGVDRRLGRTVAVKVLRSDLATDPTFQARFRREAQSAASLNHPSIVAVYDTGEEYVGDISVPYIVMEYVEGRTLRDVLREGRRILPERALEITAEVLEALEYSHRAGIVHRDIKPGNVMLTPTGDVKVMDFGIARAVADASATMTQTAAVIGTAQYLSPEQARGESVDARSDIYSTGCLLYELLTGRPPFVGDSPVSVAYQHVREEPRPPSMLDPEVSPEADAITLKALAKRATDRYQSAEEMRQDIVRCLAGQRVSAPVPAPATAYMPATGGPPMGPPMEEEPDWGYEEQPEPQEKGRKVAYVLLTVALLFILGVIGFVAYQMLSGPSTVTVPDLEGLTREEAEQELEEAGLTLGKVSEAAYENVPEGRVASQDPEADAKVEEGQAVDIVLSSGVPKVEVPDVIGDQLTVARNKLIAEGLEVEVKTKRKSDRPQNEVLASDPPAGTPLPKGATVTLTVSAGLVKVPNVLETSESRAVEDLEAAGLEVETTYEVTSDYSPGIVFGQDPEAGTWVKPGSTVTITVAEEQTYPDLSIAASVSGEIPVTGGPATVQVDITNVGDGTSGAGSVTITMPEGVTITAIAEGCSASGQQVTCSVSELEPGAGTSIQMDVEGGPNAPGTTLQGTAAVTSQGDADTSNNSTTVDIVYAPF